MSKFTRLFFVLALSALAAGCATATSDPESTTRIESDPSGATCTLQNTKGYSKQVVTPASVTLHRDLAPLSIACTAPGHASIREEFKMDGNAMVLGNILIGGLIGVAVDAASGAAEKFPENITVFLDPSEFDSIADRDQWYEKKKARIKKQAQKREIDLDNAEYICLRNLPDCLDRKDALEAQKNLELAKLENVRRTATVRQASTVINVKGLKRCLVQTGDNSWESRPCAVNKPEPKRARVELDGKQQCLVQVKPNTWEARPCPGK